MGVLVGLIYFRLGHLRTAVADDLTGESLQALINQAMNEIAVITLVTLVGFAIVCFIYSVVITHRIAGPIVAICRYIEEIKAGRYDPNRKLRKYDDLQPIMNSLNELAAHLKDKKTPPKN